MGRANSFYAQSLTIDVRLAMDDDDDTRTCDIAAISIIDTDLGETLAYIEIPMNTFVSPGPASSHVAVCGFKPWTHHHSCFERCLKAYEHSLGGWELMLMVLACVTPYRVREPSPVALSLPSPPWDCLVPWL